jgi:hypothetical protein
MHGIERRKRSDTRTSIVEITLLFWRKIVTETKPSLEQNADSQKTPLPLSAYQESAAIIALGCGIFAFILWMITGIRYVENLPTNGGVLIFAGILSVVSLIFTAIALVTLLCCAYRNTHEKLDRILNTLEKMKES